MTGKLVISVVVMFIMSFGLGFLAHGVLLHADYAQFPNLMRPMAEAPSYLPYILLAHLFTAIGFSWIYLKGKEDKPWLDQGIRYGVAVAVLMVIPLYLIYHAVMPFPLSLAIKQILYDTVRIMLMGVVLAWLNR